MTHGPKHSRWNDLSPRKKAGVIVVVAAQIALHAYAWRDLVTRPADQIKGTKVSWGVALLVNWVGPIAYLAVGRERR